MFKTGQVVSYGLQGIYKISGISEKQIGKKNTEYYVLSSVYGNLDSKVFVPVDNDILVSRLHNIVSQKEALKIVKNFGFYAFEHIEDDTERYNLCRDMLSSGDCADAARVAVSLCAYNNERKKIGKKLNSSDSKMFDLARKLLFEHLSFALDESVEKIKNIFVTQMER